MIEKEAWKEFWEAVDLRACHEKVDREEIERLRNSWGEQYEPENYR